jgi:hypothetical protein
MKVFIYLTLIFFAALYSASGVCASLLGLKPNACIMYTEKMQYYCEYESSELSCSKYLKKDYYGEKVIKTWFYYNRYCREFGFKSNFR